MYKIYSRAQSGGSEHLLFDPLNCIKGKVMDVSLDINEDGSFMLLNLGEDGKEISNSRIMNIKTLKLLNDEIKFADGKFLTGSKNEIIIKDKKSGCPSQTYKRLCY